MTHATALTRFRSIPAKPEKRGENGGGENQGCDSLCFAMVRIELYCVALGIGM